MGDIIQSVEDSLEKDVDLQQRAKMRKEEIMRDKVIATDQKQKHYADAVLTGMHKTERCITDPRAITPTLKKLKSDMERRELLMDNINIRVKGFGGKWKKDFHITFTHQRKLRPIKDLEYHLQKILEAENDSNSKYVIPKEAPIAAVLMGQDACEALGECMEEIQQNVYDQFVPGKGKRKWKRKKNNSLSRHADSRKKKETEYDFGLTAIQLGLATDD